MPYTDAHLPFAGSSPQPRHASYLGARSAEHRADSQRDRYLQQLREHEHGLTDTEAADLLAVERSSINARRVPLVKSGVVYADGFREGAHGVRNTVWKIGRP